MSVTVRAVVWNVWKAETGGASDPQRQVASLSHTVIAAVLEQLFIILGPFLFGEEPYFLTLHRP